MYFLYLKALHIVFVITWFAGLFYVVRLFIYQTEALDEEEPARSILSERLALMTRRLWYIITWPSAIITLILGSWALYIQDFHLQYTYMWIKIGLVTILYLYHFACHRIFLALQKGKAVFSSTKLRIWNEISTILLIGIVFLIVVKSAISLAWGLGGLLVLMVIFFVIIKIYKGKREKNS